MLTKLILRAEKRKAKAENFLVYALLQSTVERLKWDSHLLENKRLKSLKGDCISKEDGTNSFGFICSDTLCHPKEITFEEGDPLNLDDFFSRLKRCK